MKKYLTIQGLALLLLFSGCELLGIEVKEDEEAKRRAFLVSRTWKAVNVLNEGVDVTSEFVNFELTFSSAVMTARNGGLAFPNSIGWQFGFDENTIERDDAVSMTMTNINEGAYTYRLRFIIPDRDSRTVGIFGSYEFRLEAK